jgi:RNA polymerase sigma-70 factor (ECF subfamily)
MEHAGLTAQYSALLRDAQRIVGNPDEAEDIVQKTVCDALNHYRDLRDPSRLSGWLRSINRRNALDYFKFRRRRRECRFDPSSFVLVSQDSGRDYTTVLTTALSRLKQREKFVLEEHYFNGAKFAEIGLKLGASSGAVRTSLLRARRKLKRILRSNPMQNDDGDSA